MKADNYLNSRYDAGRMQWNFFLRFKMKFNMKNLKARLK